MEKMAQDTSPVGQSEGGNEANNSDSGDSVFITQKHVPAAVRSGRRKHPRLGSTWTREGEDDISSSSSSDGESTANRKRRRRRRRVLGAPTYRLSFLPQTRDLPHVEIKKLHNYVMGGYFKSVQELWASYEQGVDLTASLPTIDVPEEWISPISEEEKEETVDEDIKVVERKRFVTSLKAKSSQPWYTPKTRPGEEGKPSRAVNGSQGEREVATSKPVLKETPSSATQTPEREGTPCRNSKEAASQAASDVHVRAPSETPKTGKLRKGKKKQLGSESDAMLNEGRTQTGRDPHTEVLHADEQSGSGDAERGHGNPNLPGRDVNNDPLSVKRMKKRGKGGEKGREQSPEETEGQHEEDRPDSKPKKEKKKPAAEEGGRTNAAAQPPTDEVKKNRKGKDPNATSDLCQTPTEHLGEVGAHFEDTQAPPETSEPSFTTRKKHKEKKSFCTDAATNPDLTGKKKRKKKMVDSSLAAEEDVDKPQKEEQDAELGTKKKKKLKENPSATILEEMMAAVNRSEFVRKKNEKGTSSFLATDEEEQHDPSQAVSAGSAELAERLEGLKDGVPKKKKKKKKRSAVQERVDGETEFEETAEAEEVKKKKKRKRNDGKLAGPTERGAEEPQTDAAVSPRKRKTKKKKDTQEIPPAATEDAESEASALHAFSSDSPKKKLKKKKEKAAEELSPERKSCPKTQKPKQTGRTKPEASEASPHSLKQKKKRKRKLHSQNQDFLSDF
ncbi:nucleolar and coiled-body phosphoprotein 1 [Kryptolebias marmoratus]|uniref:nucleolar and coiled-body phosphoprotein 1 n=1 Tax=Kryptolebias marmoratus TaxID=37003 RepID=UPI0007F8C203|nr:nucleolar and coiled-body phosphoprotein 1 [Kryptolebias marmoratus]